MAQACVHLWQRLCLSEMGGHFQLLFLTTPSHDITSLGQVGCFLQDLIPPYNMVDLGRLGRASRWQMPIKLESRS